MSKQGQLQPPRSDITDQHKNNSFKSLKTSQYESKIYELSNQVKVLRDKLMEMEYQKGSSFRPEQKESVLADRNTQLEKYVNLLREDNDNLKKENLILRERVKNLENMMGKRKYMSNDENGEKAELASVKSLREMRNNKGIRIGKSSELQGGFYSNKNSVHLSSGATSVTTNLMRQLLVECNQPCQSIPMTKADRKVEKDQFYEYKDTQDCFQPFFSNISKQQRIRLKRCLVKQKQLLLVDNNVQIGTISPYKSSQQDPPQIFKMMLVITNIGLIPVTKVCLQYIYSNDVHITKKCLLNSKQALSSKYQTVHSQPLQSNEQLKQQLQITINNIDFKCIKLNFSYEVNKSKNSYMLILPISKIKMFKEMPYTSTNNNIQKVQRVIEFQKKIISQLGKIKHLFGHIYESRDKNGIARYCWKVLFLGKPFWLEMYPVQQKLGITVSFENDRVLGEKILGQMIFLFKKI